MGINPHNIVIEPGSEYVIVNLWIGIVELHNVTSVGLHLGVVEYVFWPVPCAVEYVILL